MSIGIRTAAADAVEGAGRTLPPFVGRDAELQALLGAWDLAVTGDRQIVLVSGDPGIGKTTLAAELAKQARKAGAWVLTGSSPPGRAVPYAPMIEALAEAARSAPLDVLTRRPLLAHVVPEIRARVTAPPPIPADRAQLFWDVVGLLGDLSDLAPVLLVLDDLHRADRSTIRLLQYVLPRTADCSMLVIAAYCDTSVDRADPFSSLLIPLLADRDVHHLVLPGIARQAVPEVLPSPSALDAVWNRSEGNPLFLAELLRHVDPSLPRIDPRTLPRSVELGVTRRLARLDPTTRQLLAVASLIGQEFTLELVAASGEVPWSRITESAQEALDAAIIRPIVGTTSFCFTHEVVRLAVERRVALHRGVQVHGRIRKSLEEASSSAAADVARLAFHAAAAAPVGGSMSAARYAAKAGDQAIAVLAYDEAAGWYGQALGLVTGIGRETSEVRCRLLLSLADAHDRSGDKIRARQAYLEAAVLAKALDDATSLARATKALADQVAQQVPAVERSAVSPTAAGPRPAGTWAPAIRTVTPPSPTPPPAASGRIPPPPPPAAPAPGPRAASRSRRATKPAAKPASPRQATPKPAFGAAAPPVPVDADATAPPAAPGNHPKPDAKPYPKASAKSSGKSSAKSSGSKAKSTLPSVVRATARSVRRNVASARDTDGDAALVEDLAEITGLTPRTMPAPRVEASAPPPTPPLAEKVSDIDVGDIDIGDVGDIDIGEDFEVRPDSEAHSDFEPRRGVEPTELDSGWAGVYDPRPSTSWVRENPTSMGHSYSHGRVVNSIRARHSRVWGPEDLDERLRASDEIIEMATASEDAELALEGHGWRLVDRLEMGRVVQADEDIAAHSALANASGDPRHRRDAATWSVMRALLDGRFLDARSALLDVKAFGERARDPQIAQMACSAQQFWLTLEWGSDAEVSNLLEHHRTEIPRDERGPAWRSALALLLARTRRGDEARAELDAITDHELETRPHDAVWLQMAACSVEAAQLVGDTRIATALAPLFGPFADRVVVGSRGLICLGSAARYAGVATAMLEQWDLSERYFDTAVQVNRRLGSGPQLAHTEADRGYALMRRGRRNDHKRGEAIMTAAAAQADELEMRRLAATTRLRRGGR